MALGVLRHFQPIVYATLQPDRLSLRDVKSGRSVSEPPLVALSRETKRRLLGVGEDAKRAAATHGADLVNPFKHPRTLLADFTAGQLVFKALLRKLFEGRLFVAAPLVVLHPLGDPEGGLTEIEVRALQELAVGAGASKVYVWHGRQLSDEELLALNFDSGGELLNR